MKYGVVRLREVIQRMGLHYRSSRRDDLTFACPNDECGVELTQRVSDTVNEYAVPLCPYCEMPVIVYDSNVWSGLFGSPGAAEKKLGSVAEDPVGRWLVSLAGYSGFANPSAKNRWDRLVRLAEKRVEHPKTWLMDVITGCRSSLRGKGRSMKGLITYSMNAIEKRLREMEEVEESPVEVERW